MRRDETFAVIGDKLQQILSLLIIERDLAVAHEKDGIDVSETGAPACRLTRCLERTVRDDVGIRSYIGVVKAGFVADALNRRQSVASRFVLTNSVSSVGPGKDYFAAGAPAASPAAAAAARSTLTSPTLWQRSGLRGILLRRILLRW